MLLVYCITKPKSILFYAHLAYTVFINANGAEKISPHIPDIEVLGNGVSFITRRPPPFGRRVRVGMGAPACVAPFQRTLARVAVRFLKNLWRLASRCFKMSPNFVIQAAPKRRAHHNVVVRPLWEGLTVEEKPVVRYSLGASDAESTLKNAIFLLYILRVLSMTERRRESERSDIPVTCSID